MPAPIAVGLDFDHTLGIDNKLERTVALEMLSELALGKGIAYDAAEAETAIDDVLEHSRSADTAIDIAIAGFLERFAPSGSATLDTATDFRDNVVARAPSHIVAQPGADALLAALDAQGIRYAILTNGWSPLQEEKARLIGFRGSVFVSERIGARKPDRGAFDFLAKHFELPPAQIWYVGDDPEVDIAGAAAAGMTSVWYDWEGRTYPSDMARPTHTIAALDELPALLQGRMDGLAKLKK
ncbi:MAG: hypothetical protein NVS3B16_03030 [Vulcanimicrobiaceae bacterium]